jgi:hypothetical protein
VAYLWDIKHEGIMKNALQPSAQQVILNNRVKLVEQNRQFLARLESIENPTTADRINISVTRKMIEEWGQFA